MDSSWSVVLRSLHAWLSRGVVLNFQPLNRSSMVRLITNGSLMGILSDGGRSRCLSVTVYPVEHRIRGTYAAVNITSSDSENRRWSVKTEDGLAALL